MWTGDGIRTSAGRYIVLEVIGRGGMGRVLRARDPELQREVAIKELRRETLCRKGARRLVDEARAMAKLSHVNVVPVYDVAEVADGEVVLVMEYVRGQTLAAWLQRPRSWSQIVGYFREAGRGLAAAHAAGLLHRDFKLDNVLVGDDGRVRVTDFGLARELALADTDPAALEARTPCHDAHTPPSSEPRARTEPGTIVGTLPYLAPERLLGAPANAASDQFAFCVSLWEALFGERPFAGRSLGELALAMSIGRPRPPPRRSDVPPWLVETIARGLAKDAEDRWPNMDALLDALVHDPATRRRRWLLAAACASVLAIGVEAWAGTRAQPCTEAAAAAHLRAAWHDRRAEVHDAVLGIGASYALDVWTRTERALEDYAAAWTRMHVDACEATTVRGQQSAAVMDLRMACLHRASVELSAVTRVLASADARTVQRAHDVLATLPRLDRCADVEALQAALEPPLPEEAATVEAVRAELARASAAREAGDLDEAARALDAATASLASVSHGPVQSEVARANGQLLAARGDYEQASDALREALRLASRWRHRDEMQAAATQLLYVIGHRLNRFDEALRYGELARSLAEGDGEREAHVLASFAAVLGSQGKYAEAVVAERRALALLEAHDPDDPDVAMCRSNLAGLLRSQSKYAEAEVEHRRVLAAIEHTLGPDHPDVATTRHNLAVALHDQGEYEQAEAEHRRALQVLEVQLGPDHPHVAACRNNFANTLHAQGKHEQAAAQIRTALAITERALGPDHPSVAMARNSLAAVLQAQGQLDEAEVEYRRAITEMEAALGPDHDHVAQFRHNLALSLHSRGKYDEAEAEQRHALASLQKALGPDHPAVASSHHHLAATLEALGRNDEAEPEFRRGLAVRELALGRDHLHVAASQISLAGVLVERGARVEEARELAEAAWTRLQRDDAPPEWRTAAAAVLERLTRSRRPRQGSSGSSRPGTPG